MKTCSVLGALGEGDVRMRMEWSLICAVNLIKNVHVSGCWVHLLARESFQAENEALENQRTTPGKHLRHRHEELLIHVARQLGLDAQPLLPSLLHHGLAHVPLRLVEGDDAVKVDLAVQ